MTPPPPPQRQRRPLGRGPGTPVPAPETDAVNCRAPRDFPAPSADADPPPAGFAGEAHPVAAAADEPAATSGQEVLPPAAAAPIDGALDAADPADPLAAGEVPDRPAGSSSGGAEGSDVTGAPAADGAAPRPADGGADVAPAEGAEGTVVDHAAQRPEARAASVPEVAGSAAGGAASATEATEATEAPAAATLRPANSPVGARGAGSAVTEGPLDPPAVGEAGPRPEDEAVSPSAEDDGRFTVVLENFEGPFDLLLQLISRHKLDVTEVALSRVTDEFMAYIRAMGPDWDLDQTTEFLVVAATLLDLKAARLLPAAEVEDEADLALLEARDLLFARLLQYRAFKRVADIFAERLAAEALRHPRTVGLEPHHAELLPDVVIRVGPEGFARLAVKAMRPKPKPQVYVDHIHAPLVSVREQAEVMIARLRQVGRASFGELVEDAPDTLTVVARFLALLELYRERAVTLDQEEALGTLLVAWSGGELDRPLVTDEFDQESAPRDGKERP